MTYRLRANSNPRGEMRRVLASQNQKALSLLDNWEQDPAGNIHKARQSFKRIRALMSLVRDRYAYVYHVENRAYRDLARRLSYTRDASAMVEAADRLAERIWEPGPRQSLLMLRKSLVTQAECEVAEAVAGMSATVDAVRHELPLLATRIAGLPLDLLQHKYLRQGAKKTLGRAHKHYSRIDLSSGPESYHDWRKHLKYAYYQTTLMSQLLPKWSRRYHEPLGELAALLGNAQDLAVLSELLASQPDELGIDLHFRRLRNIVSDVQRDMHMHAIAMGRELFDRAGPARQRAAVTPIRLHKQSA